MTHPTTGPQPEWHLAAHGEPPLRSSGDTSRPAACSPLTDALICPFVAPCQPVRDLSGVRAASPAD